MSQDRYSIYQVKDDDEMWGVRFEPVERLQATGRQVNRINYDLVYAGALEYGNMPTNKILEKLYAKFNIAHPLDFVGRSLSVSDVVVLRRGEKLIAHYVDSFGFAEVPEFLNGPYWYYSTQRPVDIGTFPKTENGPEHIANYHGRIPIENGRFEAWGALGYSAPLTEKQIEDYELRAAFDNPDSFCYPPRQLDGQLRVVGLWETKNGIPDEKRFSEWESDTEKFKWKNPSDRWFVNVRFKKIVAEHERRSIAAQLAESAERAAKDNAARPKPEKKSDMDRD